MNEGKSWDVKCGSCGETFVIIAPDECNAIEVAKNEHDRKSREATAFRCDTGPTMDHAFPHIR